jgi:hypothetical protein
MRTKACLLGLSLGALLGGGSALAAVTGYQTQAGFLSAALGTIQVTNFDAATAGAPYTGNSPASPSFSLTANSLGPVTPYVMNTYWTTSGTNYLGLDNSDSQFLSGDSLTFALTGSVRAFGLYVITGVDVQAGDISLTSGTDNVSNSGLADLADSNGSYAYFLGLVSDTDFSSLTLNFGDGSFPFVAAVDDVILAGTSNGGGGSNVPEPSVLSLFGLAAILAAASARRGRQAFPTSEPKEQTT